MNDSDIKVIANNFFCFLKKKEIEHNKHINNQHQEAFMVLIINYTFAFFFCVCYAKYFF